MESGKRSVLKRSRPTESPRKMSYLALDRGTAKPPFVGSNPTRASTLTAAFLQTKLLTELSACGFLRSTRKRRDTHLPLPYLLAARDASSASEGKPGFCP